MDRERIDRDGDHASAGDHWPNGHPALTVVELVQKKDQKQENMLMTKAEQMLQSSSFPELINRSIAGSLERNQ